MEIEPLFDLFQKNEKMFRKHLKEEELSELKIAFLEPAKLLAEEVLAVARKPKEHEEEQEVDPPVINLTSVMEALHLTSPIEALKALFKTHSPSS
jgi:hypothetical protein